MPRKFERYDGYVSDISMTSFKAAMPGCEKSEESWHTKQFTLTIFLQVKQVF